MSERPYSRVDLLTRNWRLRLRVPCAVPTDAIRNSQPGRGLPLVLPIEPETGLVCGKKRIGRVRSFAIQAKSLEIEKWIRVVEVLQSSKLISASLPSSEGIFSIDEGVNIAPELDVVLGKRVGKIILRLHLSIVVIGRQIEALPERSVRADLDFRRTRKNRVTFSGLALHQHAYLVNLPS